MIDQNNGIIAVDVSHAELIIVFIFKRKYVAII